jgi:hypothetical protein
MFGHGTSEPREVSDLYEKIGRRFVSDQARGEGGALIAAIIELQQDVARLTREVRDLRADLRKSGSK